MSKAVLISIRPKWCELIASGKKTIEVRKTRPKMETPFKCYIYCTKPRFEHEDFFVFDAGEESARACYCGGKIIGEFSCDAIYRIWAGYAANLGDDCMSYDESENYLGTGMGYGWHISDLKIYDQPRELAEFYAKKKCDACKRGDIPSACIYDDDCIVPAVLTRPPQSWCYVEEG